MMNVCQIILVSMMFVSVSALAQNTPNELVVPVAGSNIIEVPLNAGILDSYSHLPPASAANRCAAGAAKQYPQFSVISIKLVKNQQGGCLIDRESICLWECKSAMVTVKTN